MTPAGGAHRLVEAALLAAVAVVLVLLALLLPVVGPLLALALPVPATLAYVRRGARAGLAVVFVAGVLAMVIEGPLVGLTAAVSLGTVGMALGWALSHRWGAVAAVAAAAAGALALTAFTYATSLLFLHQNPLSQMVAAATSAGQQVTALYAKAGVPAAEGAALKQAFGALRDTIVQLWPSLLIFAMLFAGLVNYLLTAAVLRRLGQAPPALPAFAQWRLPWPLAAGPVAGLLLLRLAPGSALLQAAGINLWMTFSSLFAIVGVAVVYAVLRHFRAPRSLAAVICVAMPLLSGVLYELLIWVGLFDAFFRYRDLLRPRAA